MQLRSRVHHVQKNADSSEFAVTFYSCAFFFHLLHTRARSSRSRPDSATLFFFTLGSCARLLPHRVSPAPCFAWMYPTVPPATLEQNPRCSANERVPPQQPSASHCSSQCHPSVRKEGATFARRGITATTVGRFYFELTLTGFRAAGNLCRDTAHKQVTRRMRISAALFAAFAAMVGDYRSAIVISR